MNKNEKYDIVNIEEKNWGFSFSRMIILMTTSCTEGHLFVPSENKQKMFRIVYTFNSNELIDTFR